MIKILLKLQFRLTLPNVKILFRNYSTLAVKFVLVTTKIIYRKL